MTSQQTLTLDRMGQPFSVIMTTRDDGSVVAVGDDLKPVMMRLEHDDDTYTIISTDGPIKTSIGNDRDAAAAITRWYARRWQEQNRQRTI